MKAGRTIQEMAVEIQRQSEAKADFLVNTGRLQMAVWDGQPMLHLLSENGEDQMEPLEVLTTAHRQLGTYLNIPQKYYDRMLQEDPDSGNALQQLWNEPVLHEIYPLYLYRVQGYLFPQLYRQSGVQFAANGAGDGKAQSVYERAEH